MTVSRICWCRDLDCRFVVWGEGEKCPSPKPPERDASGYSTSAEEAKDKWRGRLFVGRPMKGDD